MSASSDWIVLKFGGTSVRTPDEWRTIAQRIAAVRSEGARVLVVHSAVRGVSDALDQLVDAAAKGETGGRFETIKRTHLDLAKGLGVDGPGLLRPHFDQLERWTAGLELTGDPSPRMRARLMSLGERMASSLGAAFLKAEGVDIALADARDLLHARPADGVRGWLSAECSEQFNPVLLERLDAAGAGAILTQGFIARREDGETALLGRGGSDCSASWLGAQIGARRVEIWTDVPGFFSADPRITGAARQIKALSYEEAQELASMGASVLHPRAIAPVRRSGIELHVLSTHAPQEDGTRITATPSEDAPRLKAVSVKRDVRLITLQTGGMWRRAGFLAEAFAPFARRGVSIDLVSTSETSVTVSLDSDPGLTEDTLDGLLEELRETARVEMREHCAAVSLVGRGVRALLAQLGPAMEAFAHHPVHLISQAANDLNLTVVVDGDQGAPLARRLHDSLIRPRPLDPTFGPSWREFSEPEEEHAPETVWWRKKAAALIAMTPADAPLYVYDLETIRERARALAALRHPSRIFYAMKANAHPEVLRAIAGEGLGIECVSMGEVETARAAIRDLSADRILFTPNFAPRSEYERAIAMGLHLTIDGLHPLREWADVFKGAAVTLRVNPQRPEGHHKHVRTAGPEAKFGLHACQLAEARELAERAGVRIEGLHVHAGSGVSDPEHWKRMGAFLLDIAGDFPDLRVLDLGGGLGVSEAGGARRVDVAKLDDSLAALKAVRPDLEFWLEPGRYLVAEAGVLLARVTQVKDTPDARFIGVNAGMNSLIRPALYGARHEIVNLSRLDEKPSVIADIVGPICESADRLGAQRLLPVTREGDVMLIANGGAYGAVMASRYNLREPAGEAVI